MLRECNEHSRGYLCFEEGFCEVWPVILRKTRAFGQTPGAPRGVRKKKVVQMSSSFFSAPLCFGVGRVVAHGLSVIPGILANEAG